MKPTFTARYASGKTEVFSYTPLIVISGSEVHKLALHKDGLGFWQVSHPTSGAMVCHVNGSWKGIRVASQGFSLKEIRQLAQSDVDAVINRVGTEKFNQVLAAGKTRN